MRTLLLFFYTTVMGSTSPGYAHDANFAAIKIIHQQSSNWTFELKTPRYELDRSMRHFNEERSLDLTDLTVGTTRYKELIVEYVRATFKLDIDTLVDSKPPTSTPVLGSGRIKLDEHESVLIFKIENMPAAIERLTLRLPFMANNSGQHNILWLIDGQRSKRIILSEDNQFTVIGTVFFDGDVSQNHSDRKPQIEIGAHASTSI